MTFAAVALGVFLVGVGASHFVLTRYYCTLVPPWIPGARFLVFASGGVEILLGVGILVPATRSAAAWGATGLMAVYVLVHAEAGRRTANATRVLDAPAGIAARVLVNLAYLAWAAAVAAWA